MRQGAGQRLAPGPGGCEHNGLLVVDFEPGRRQLGLKDGPESIFLGLRSEDLVVGEEPCIFGWPRAIL